MARGVPVFANIEQLSDTVLAFINRYNTTATLFNWNTPQPILKCRLTGIPPAPAKPLPEPT